MRVCTKKKHVSHAKSWISMLNSAGIQQKTASVPAYNNLYAYAMTKKFMLILTLVFVFLISGCNFSKPQIILWEYNENLESELFNNNQVSDLSSSVCKKGIVIPFSNFQEFDNVRKIFYFKSKSEAEKFQKKIWTLTPRDDYNYYFSIIKNDKILLSGYFISTTNFSAYQNKSKETVKMFFTYDCNLRMATDVSFQNFPDLVELLDTKEIESYLPLKYKKNRSNEAIYKDNNEYFVYLCNDNLLFDINMNQITPNSYTLSNSNKDFSESYSNSEGLIQHWLTADKYSETTFVCKNQASNEFPAVKKVISMDNGITVELDIFHDGNVKARIVNFEKSFVVE